MDVFTLYVGQGALAAVRAGNEAVIVDAHMPNTDEVTPEQVQQSLGDYLRNSHVRGLILTGLDGDHAHADGVDCILTNHEPDWVMYPTYYKDTECASQVFSDIERHVRRRANTGHPLNAQTLLHVTPNTVLISAGVDSQYNHPDPAAVRAYQAVARHVFSTNATPDGTCLFTRRVGTDFETQLVRHPTARRAAVR